MKKLILVLSVLLIICTLASCGADTAKNVDLAKVKEQMVSDLSITGAMDVKTDRLLDLYGIAEEDVKQSACFVTMDGIFPDEIIMVESAGAAAATRVSEKLENRLAEVKNQSKSYDAENYALAQKCKVSKNGNYVALFISAKHEEMQKIYDAFVK